MLDPAILAPAIVQSLKKLDPRLMARNPVMFVVEMVVALTTVLFLRDLLSGRGHLGFSFQIVLWLWFTLLFANLAEAVAEGRGKAQAATLRRAKTETVAKLLASPDAVELAGGARASRLKVGDVVLVETGDLIPSDGEVVEGVASVNEAAITGESAPVIRESGGDRSAVTGGTLVTSDWIKVRITAAPGSTFLDRMIALVEGAKRQKTPERDSAQHPPRRHDPDLRRRGGDDPELCRLCRRHDIGPGPGRALRHPDPDHDRRAALGHRHRRHGPPRALQRARHVRARGRGCGRRRHAAARQDRHDHAGQPAGDRARAGGRHDRARARRCGPALLAARRDARGPLDRRAGQGALRHPRPRHGAPEQPASCRSRRRPA